MECGIKFQTVMLLLAQRLQQRGRIVQAHALDLMRQQPQRCGQCHDQFVALVEELSRSATSAFFLTARITVNVASGLSPEYKATCA